MPQPLSQITLRGSGNSDSWKSVLKQKIENMPCVSRIGLLLAHHRSADRGGIADPKLVLQLGEDPLEPLRVPGRLHAHSHRLLQTGVKLLGLTVSVLEAAFEEFSRLSICLCDWLKTGIKV